MSDLLIKGMEMPTGELGAIPLMLYADGCVEHFFSHEKLGTAVLVPPHGRLIDADALMKKIEHDTPLSAVFEKTMRRYLHNAPTIIMRLRGCAIGAQPKEGFLEREDDPLGDYWDVIIYSRPLSEKERLDYDLDYLGTRRRP